MIASYKVQSKMKKIIVLIIFIIILAADTEAAIWDKFNYAPGATNVKEEEVLRNNTPVKITTYQTTQNAKYIGDFYKQKLGNFGWNLVSEYTQGGENLFYFNKDKKYMVVAVLSGLLPDKRVVSIAQGQEEKCESCIGKSKITLPEDFKTQDKEKKELWVKQLTEKFNQERLNQLQAGVAGRDLDSVPRYPGSTRVSSTEKKNPVRVNLTYISKNNLNEALDFYRSNMQSYHWKLDKEISLSEVTANTAKLSQAQGVPTLEGRSLIFVGSGRKVMINVIKNPRDGSTIIGVVYNEK